MYYTQSISLITLSNISNSEKLITLEDPWDNNKCLTWSNPHTNWGVDSSTMVRFFSSCGLEKKQNLKGGHSFIWEHIKKTKKQEKLKIVFRHSEEKKVLGIWIFDRVDRTRLFRKLLIFTYIFIYEGLVMYNVI